MAFSVFALEERKIWEVSWMNSKQSVSLLINNVKVIPQYHCSQHTYFLNGRLSILNYLLRFTCFFEQLSYSVRLYQVTLGSFSFDH